jgi:hypothetical protein
MNRHFIPVTVPRFLFYLYLNKRSDAMLAVRGDQYATSDGCDECAGTSFQVTEFLAPGAANARL